jgi:sialidase-1
MNRAASALLMILMAGILFAGQVPTGGSLPGLRAGRDYVVVCRDGGAGGYEAFPDVCRLSDGRLMSVFYASYDHVGLPNERWPKGGRIDCAFSSDEGRTWSAARVLFDGPDDDRDPSIVQGGCFVISFP